LGKGQTTRERIVALAAPIFNQKGYAGTALSDLMSATGLEKGGIYRHFTSKQELAGEAFEHAWKVALDTRFAGTGEIPNAVDRLKQIILNFRDRRDGLVPGGCPLLNTAVDADDSNPQLRAKARQALSSWLDILQSNIKEAQQRGDIRSGLEPLKFATLIVSTLEGALVLSRLQKSLEPLDLACAHLTEYLETNVRTKKSRRSASRAAGKRPRRKSRML
jgi:TetR/AcrR family transcriptional regulator, transcriptional repressor for nem operon